jgi:hypothetical protein
MNPAAIAKLLSFLNVKHEDLEGGHERIVVLGIPVWDSRRAARRMERRKKRIELRKARRDARK